MEIALRKHNEYKENSQTLWNKLWADDGKSFREHKFNLAVEEQGTVWRSIRTMLGKKFDNVGRLHVVELGAGRGAYSALMAQIVHQVTMVDYSDAAIEKSKEFYEFLGISNVNHLHADALRLPVELMGKYDVSMSFGLAEHFAGDERRLIIKSHFDLLKPNGLTFISVPNKDCIPYQLWKKKRELLGRWHFGLEIPFSRKELRNICDDLQIEKYFFVGSSFLSSLNFLLPLAQWKRSLEKRLIPNYFDRLDLLRPSVMNPLDSYLGYALVLCGQNSPPGIASSDIGEGSKRMG